MHGAVGQRPEQQIAQLAALDLGAASVTVVRLLHADHGVLIEDAHGLAAGVDERAELLVQIGGAQGGLAGLLMDVEHAALPTGGR